MQINLHNSITRADTYRACVFYYMKSAWRRLWLGLAVVCALIAILSAFQSGLGVLSYILLAYSALLILAPRINAAVFTRRVFSRPNPITEADYEFSDEGIHCTSTIGEQNLLWTAYIDWKESSEAFLLFIQKGNFFIIPKRCFESDQQIQDFRSLLHDKMAHSRRVGNPK